MRKFKFGSIITIALLSLASHFYVLYRLIAPEDARDKVFMTGANDGLEQMLPMQLYLYEKFREGTWFYDMDFGLGGDFYTDLAYYYSTNVVFYINMICVRIGEFILGFDPSTVEFWAYNAFFISMLKTFFIIYFTYRFLKFIGVKPVYAIIGGFIFAASPTYFRFTIFWSFFSDVFLWLPLTLWALEILIRKGRPGLFIFSVALTLINNFYFAYYQLIIALVYLAVRLVFRRKTDIGRKETLRLAVPSALIGFGISMVAFFHAVRGFLNNDDREYEVSVPLFEELGWQDNIFYENYLVVIIFLAVQALFTRRLYGYYYYRLFAVLTIVFMLFTLTPYVDMFFNGFQQPQKRWHYMLVFFHAVVIAQYLTYFRQIRIKEYLISLVPVYIILALSIQLKGDIVIWTWLVPLIQLAGLLILWRKKSTFFEGVKVGLIILFTLMVSASHTNTQIYHEGITDRNHLFYLGSNHYASERQRHNIGAINEMKNPEQKIDYKVREQDNTPMYMGFSGASIYSSIIDGALIDFYYNDLKVNIRYESISRYSSFQSRSNLFSLFNADYMMRDEDHYGIPEKFTPTLTDGTYTIYENEAPLPFIRYAEEIHDPDALDSPLEREHAMIRGAVTDALEPTGDMETPENVLDAVEIDTIGASYRNGILEVSEDGGGLDFDFSTLLEDIDDPEGMDAYIEMHVELLEPEKRFTINVDGYPNERLFASSKYRTYADDLLYRVPLEPDIEVTFPSGIYEVDVQRIQIENYDTLESASAEPAPDYEFIEHPNSYEIALEAPREGVAVVPIIYRDGMVVRGNDSGELDSFRANYVMTGFKAGADDSVIEISYTPPNYWLTLLFSIISMIAALLYIDHHGQRRISGRLKRNK